VKTILPAGVEVSICSERETKSIPNALNAGEWVAQDDLLALVGGSRGSLRKVLAGLKEKAYEIKKGILR